MWKLVGMCNDLEKRVESRCHNEDVILRKRSISAEIKSREKVHLKGNLFISVSHPGGGVQHLKRSTLVRMYVYVCLYVQHCSSIVITLGNN